MSMEYGFFNSVNGDRKKSADFFAMFFGNIIGNGIYPNPSSNFQVMANDDMTITVSAGIAWINGAMCEDKLDYTTNIDIADGVLNRVDRVVLRLDTLDREIRIDVKKGIFASEPIPPTLQRDADAYELGLADIAVNKGIVSITQANITDTRLDNELCGIVHGVVDQVDVTTLFNQYTQGFELKKEEFEQEFMSWFDTLQDVLDENTASNLLNLINEVYNDLVAHKAEKASQGEIHGLRVENNKLEFYTGTEWKIASGGIPVGNVSGLSAEEDDAEITLMWADPEDRYLDDLKIAEWQGTKIIRKEGSYPIADDDGVVVVDSTIRNQYSTNGYKDTGLTNETTYYYMAFPYTEDAISVDGTNRISATPTEIDPNSWAGIQKIVRKGLANDHFAVGDQIMANYDGVPTAFEVIGIDIDIPADPDFTHSMTIQTKDCLHDIQFDAPEPSNPDTNRKSYGNNRYIHSALKQWLNSDEATFIWQSQHQYDVKPNANPELYNGAGFLNRLDPELATVLGAVDKKVAKNTVVDGGGQEEFTDKVFLISPKEAGYTPSEMDADGVYTGETVYPFYDGKGNANRIKNLNDSPRNWWLRSPYVSSSYIVRRVYTSGSLDTNNASHSCGLSPACTIV